jgi:hypothetical protein
LLFEETNVDQLDRILATIGTRDASTVREAFLNELLWSRSVSADSDQVFRWCQRYFPLISTTATASSLTFNPMGVRYSFLFSILSEIVYNALKYTDCQEPIQINSRVQGNTFSFVCENTFSELSTQCSGSQKGLEFVGGLAQMIDGIEVLRRSEYAKFKVELRIQLNLLN